MKVPKKGSKRWKEIVEMGCGGHYDEATGDFDCKHGYEWGCDYCPVVINRIKYVIKEMNK